MSVYREQQVGGLCKKHSLNAYFNCNKLDINTFHNLENEFDVYMNDLGYDHVKCSSFDSFHSNQETLISYAVEKLDNKMSLLIPLGTIRDYISKRGFSTLHDLIEADVDFFFIFNKGHIYGARRVNNEWLIADSLRNISKIDINTLSEEGLIIPRNEKGIMKDYIFYINQIKLLLELTEFDVDFFLNKLIKFYDKFNELEIYLSLAFKCYFYISGDEHLWQRFVKWRQNYERTGRGEKDESKIREINELLFELINHCEDMVNELVGYVFFEKK